MTDRPFEASMIADLQRIGVKIFGAGPAALRPQAVVPIFHRWIQTHAIDGHTLVDVADYDHVPSGPGVVLVAHEGVFSLSRMDDDRLAMTYTRRAAAPGSLADRLRLAARSALLACRLLEEADGIGAPIRFRGDELEIFTNDRLRAPNTAEAYAAFEPFLGEVLRGLYGDGALAIASENDPNERLGVHVRAPAAVPIRTLLQRT